MKFLAKISKVGLVTSVILSLFVGISSCSQEFTKSWQDSTQKVSQSLQQLQSFQSILVNKYHDGRIGVDINYTSTKKGFIRVISIQFNNPSLNKLLSSERAKIAHDVAKLAKEHFALNKPEDSISVSFVDFHNYGVLTSNRVVDSYTLNPSDLIHSNTLVKNGVKRKVQKLN